ncbi:MAG: type II secretion system minor pseudopilin GspI [Arenicellales bacterium]
MKRARPSPSSNGFTLLEIVIALAIAALGIAAVAKATGSAATVADETRSRMLAVWVAANRLAELRITRAWPAPGTSGSTSTMGGRTWYLSQTVSKAEEDDLRRVDISVYTDARLRNREYEVFGYVAKYEPPAPSREGTGSGGTRNANQNTSRNPPVAGTSQQTSQTSGGTQ